MSMKQILAVLAATVVGYLLGFVLFGLALNGFYESHTIEYAGLHEEMPDHMWLIIAHIVWATMLVYVLVKMGINSAGKAFLPSFIISALAIMSMDMFFLSMTNLWDSAIVIPVDGIANGIWGGVMGSIAAMVLGKGASTAS